MRLGQRSPLAMAKRYGPPISKLPPPIDDTTAKHLSSLYHMVTRDH